MAGKSREEEEVQPSLLNSHLLQEEISASNCLPSSSSSCANRNSLFFSSSSSSSSNSIPWRDSELLEEIKKQLCLAAPLIAASLLQFSLQLISLMFAGHLGELPLAGASMATSFANATGFSLLVRELPRSFIVTFFAEDGRIFISIPTYTTYFTYLKPQTDFWPNPSNLLLPQTGNPYRCLLFLPPNSSPSHHKHKA